MECRDDNGDKCVAYDSKGKFCDAFGVALKREVIRPATRLLPKKTELVRCHDCRARFKSPDQGAIALLMVRRSKGA
jgi:hypothetical protein